MEKFMVGISVIIIALVLGGQGIIVNTTKEVVTITVKEKVVKINDKSSDYLIFTKEGEVFKNIDEIWVGKFNSSDFYNNLDVGTKYKVTVCGWRVPFMSWYRNILTIEKIN